MAYVPRTPAQKLARLTARRAARAEARAAAGLPPARAPAPPPALAYNPRAKPSGVGIRAGLWNRLLANPPRGDNKRLADALRVISEV